MKGILLVLGAAAALVAPAAAQADSLVFNRPDGNVWLANNDGSGLYQVTLDGTPSNPYGAPSQADDGTIVSTRTVGNNDQIFVLRQNGQVLAQFAPPVEFKLGLFDATISPDGSTIVYWTGYLGDSNCQEPPPTVGAKFCYGTYATSAAGPADEGIALSFRSKPSWMSNTRLLTGGQSQSLTTFDLGDSAETAWFGNGIGAGSLHDAELADTADKLVSLRQPNASEFAVYTPVGDPSSGANPTTAPTFECAIGGAAGGTFYDPTWAPDGLGLAWEEGDTDPNNAPGQDEGIWVWELSSPNLATACTAFSNTLVVPGGSNPDWGPADVNPGPRFVPPNPNPPQPPVPPCCTPPPDRTAPAFQGALALSASTFAAANRGASIARAPVGTRVRYRLSEAATVTFTVERQAAGRRVGRRCVKPTRANRRRPRCTRYVRVGSFVHRGRAGANSFKFTGRVRGRKLSPARYRLTGVAKDAANNTSAPRRVNFRIVRR